MISIAVPGDYICGNRFCKLTWAQLMIPLLILALAMAIVLTGILVFKLHPFLALILAAFTVAILTPQQNLIEYELSQKPLKLSGDEALQVANKAFADSIFASLAVGQNATLQVAPDESQLRTIYDWSSHEAAAQTAAANFASKPAPVRVAEGFGNTCRGIGVLIALAAIIGKCLLDSGAADKIVRTSVRWVGEPRAPAAFVASGFLLGIPVFFDTVFYLMVPLGKALRLRTGKNYLLYVLTIVAGGTMAHSLVPPTPGPLIVVEQFELNILAMIVGGTVVGLVAAAAGYAWALLANSWWNIPLRDSSDLSLAELTALADRDEQELPPFLLSLAPIALPVLFIGAGTAIKMLTKSPPNASAWLLAIKPTLVLLGDKNVALAIAAIIALATLAWAKKTSFRELASAVQNALMSAGVIILITAAGGAFGAVVRQSGVADTITSLTRQAGPFWILPIAFLVTTLIRTAQGSATVAMITAAGVLSPLALEGALPFHPVYLALAVGCGSKPIAWMADSGFWVICKMSGLTEAEALKTVTPMSIIMGLAGLLATMFGAWLLPLS